MSRRGMVAGFLASVLGLAVGMGSGVPEGKALARRLFTLRAAAVENELSRFSAMQFEHADSGHARAAVLNEIQTVDALARLSPQLATHTMPRRDENAALYLAYARLALIEQAMSNAPEAQAAQAKAHEYWSRLHPGMELSAQQMEQSVREFDRARAASE